MSRCLAYDSECLSEPSPYDLCEECLGRARWQGELGPAECWRCYGSGLEGGPPARRELEARARAAALAESRATPWREPVEKHPALSLRPIDYPGDQERCGRCGWRWEMHSSTAVCMPQPLRPPP